MLFNLCLAHCQIYKYKNNLLLSPKIPSVSTLDCLLVSTIGGKFEK